MCQPIAKLDTLAWDNSTIARHGFPRENEDSSSHGMAPSCEITNI